jgi:hypothetical protein
MAQKRAARRIYAGISNAQQIIDAMFIQTRASLAEWRSLLLRL